MKSSITQSMIKEVEEYIDGKFCGLVLKARWIDGLAVDISTEAMKLGSYFEYKLSGALPKDGKIPEAKYTGRGQLAADYARVDDYAAKIRMVIFDMRFKIEAKGMLIEKDDPEDSGLKWCGTIDLRLRAYKKVVFDNGMVIKKGQTIIVDVKYSGLLDDRWNKHGWQLADSEVQREYHGTQAKQYHYIGEDPFFFLVVSSGTKFDYRFLYIKISQEALVEHRQRGKRALARLKLEAEIGFKPHPEYKRCNACPLRHDCEHRHEFAQPEIIEI